MSEESGFWIQFQNKSYMGIIKATLKLSFNYLFFNR